MGTSALVNRITPTKLGTVLIPFQGSNGEHVVVEVTRQQFADVWNDVRLAFARIDHETEVGRMMLDIDRHEGLVD